MLRSSSAALAAAALAFAGCAAPLPPDYMRAGPWTPADRELQGRRFEGIGEAELLSASVAVLQDLGFTLETSHAGLGFVRGTMLRDAKAPEQWLLLLALAAVAGVAAGGAGGMPPVPAPSGGPAPSPDMSKTEQQTISVLLSVRPARPGDASNHAVLVTFHRELRQPLRLSAGALSDPALYQSFFELLSKAVFLQAHKL